jgi:GntR family transcriptional repressor for pyruvate dehydrogenase complex
MNIKRAQRQQVFVQVAQQIEAMIRSGELAPGDQLLPERQLAAQLQVSRASLREALALLVGKGVIAISPRDGAYIRQLRIEEAAAPLALAMRQERRQLDHLFEVRRIIETQAARLAALRHSDEDLLKLRDLAAAVARDVVASQPADETDTLFHVGIVRTARNPLLTDVMGTLIVAMMGVYGPARQRLLGDTQEAPRFLAEHEEILAAIARGDPDAAASAIEAHLAHAERALKADIATVEAST